MRRCWSFEARSELTTYCGVAAVHWEPGMLCVTLTVFEPHTCMCPFLVSIVFRDWYIAIGRQFLRTVTSSLRTFVCAFPAPVSATLVVVRCLSSVLFFPTPSSVGSKLCCLPPRRLKQETKHQRRFHHTGGVYSSIISMLSTNGAVLVNKRGRCCFRVCVFFL